VADSTKCESRWKRTWNTNGLLETKNALKNMNGSPVRTRNRNYKMNPSLCVKIQGSFMKRTNFILQSFLGMGLEYFRIYIKSCF
jgi:hypothetical protein